MEKERNVYLNDDEIPKGVKVLGIKVKEPVILLLTDEGVGDEIALCRYCTVYVELTGEEFVQAKGDQVRIDALAREFAPLVQRKLDAPWYRWSKEDGS